MGTERSDKVYEYWFQSSQKFDYFITGITGALCAYISQTFTAQPISFSPYTLELLSLLTLSTSVFAGFKRIECDIERFRWNHKSLYTDEQLGALISKSNGRTPIINEASGEIFTPEVVAKKIRILKASQSEIEKLSQSYIKSCHKWYKIRNRLLAAGFLMLIFSKTWAAY